MPRRVCAPGRGRNGADRNLPCQIGFMRFELGVESSSGPSWDRRVRWACGIATLPSRLPGSADHQRKTGAPLLQQLTVFGDVLVYKSGLRARGQIVGTVVVTPADDETDRTPEVEDSIIWQERVLCALDALVLLDEAATPTRVREMVAARFAPDFSPRSRLYEGSHEGSRPAWERQVADAVKSLVGRNLVAWDRSAEMRSTSNDYESLRLTEAGRAEAEAACQRAALLGHQSGLLVDKRALGEDPQLVGVLTQPLRDRLTGTSEEEDKEEDTRVEPSGPPLPNKHSDIPQPIMIEVNLLYGVGLPGAMNRVDLLWRMVQGSGTPTRVADQYMAGELTAAQMLAIVTADAVAGNSQKRAIAYIWPDFEMDSQIDKSCTTIKAVPAQRSFGAFGEGIIWAVLDSGIDAHHPHFARYQTLNHPDCSNLHRDFTGASRDTPDDPALALIDATGHGTHVAGIIAGDLDSWKGEVIAAEKQGLQRPFDRSRLAGVAPKAKLISLKVLGGGGDDKTRTSRVIEALAYVRRQNANSANRIHGVNLSLGYPFDPEWFACGQSPLCVAVNNLVRSGVVVVVASGNSGYVTLNTVKSKVKSFSAALTINDPGNAEGAITVGSTHRDSPHTNGISYFSSRGPTGDGRAKPDLVAPGENILSAAAGDKRSAVATAYCDGLDNAAVYVEESGTSMAAPHVSGAIAAFLSVQRELIGQPEEIKRIFMATATSLRRDPNCQGAGLVDLMRALQAQ